MSLRDQRQAEFADKWIESGMFGILNLCPRFGKIFTTINILQKLQPKKVLIAYPDNKIKDSWKSDFKLREYDDKHVTYTTYLSLHKYQHKSYDLVIFDEIHLMSDAQLDVASEMIDVSSGINNKVLGLSGTISSSTSEDLFYSLGLKDVVRYTIEQGIAEGIIPDYEIRVYTVPLDDVHKLDFKGYKKTEKKQYDNISWVINKLDDEGKDTKFLRLSRMRVIQNSIAKKHATMALLRKFADERVLVFCGVTSIADSLGIPSYHSKSSEKAIFEKFVSGEGNHLAVVKIGNTGVTYKPLQVVIVNYFNSNSENLAQQINRCMSMEYDNPEKKALIYIVCSTEEVERKWLNKALEFFDKSKVKFM